MRRRRNVPRFARYEPPDWPAWKVHLEYFASSLARIDAALAGSVPLTAEVRSSVATELAKLRQHYERFSRVRSDKQVVRLLKRLWRVSTHAWWFAVKLDGRP